jgi:hypothetical protein
MGYAYVDYEREDYELCIFKASKAKSEAETLLISISVPEDQLARVIDQQLENAKQVISKEQKLGIFPILGYSYYEYSKNLRDSDPYSSLSFVGYASELSNLDNYFPPKRTFGFSFLRVWDTNTLIAFAAGLAAGIIISVLFIRRRTTGRTRKRARPSRI